MPEERNQPQSPELEPRNRSRFWFPIAALAALAVAAAFLWVLNSRLQNLEHQLDATEQRARSAEQARLQSARERAAAEEKARAAQEQAEQAAQNAEEQEAARRQAESEAEKAREQSEAAQSMVQQALAEKDQAVAAKQKASEELERIRQRREAELNRMQQALNRVAPTRRTPTGMVMQLANDAFRFDFDSAQLRPENREMLSRIAGVLLASEGYRLFIDGHTDDVGTKEYNQSLSERRAKSVQDYLVKAGIPAGIITTQGFGKSNPLVDAKTREAREKNRRVEIGIVDTIIDYKGIVEAAGKTP